MRIDKVFDEVKKKYGLPFHLASGGLEDVKGPNTSDVDIVYITPKYMELDGIFKGARKEPRPDKQRCYYHFKCRGREVSICCSDQEAALRSVTHRRNELVLNTFSRIKNAAIVYKMNGAKTEEAYVRALGIQFKELAEVYEIMLMDKRELVKLAVARDREIKRIEKYN